MILCLISALCHVCLAMTAVVTQTDSLGHHSDSESRSQEHHDLDHQVPVLTDHAVPQLSAQSPVQVNPNLSHSETVLTGSSNIS